MSPSTDVIRHAWPNNLLERFQAILSKWRQDLDDRDGYSGRHSELAADFALLLARRLRLDTKLNAGLWVAGQVYDFGKIAVPEELLRKDGLLSDAEQLMLRRHVSAGYDLLRDWQLLRSSPRWLNGMVLDVVRYHHERWDGTGYPNGLRGDHTPLPARIIAIADAYAAMTMDSPYRHAFPVDWALAELKANAGGQFDPTLVPDFVSAVRIALRDGSFGSLRKAGGTSFFA